jgi:3D (Asp-Asp-Asp) domain-containing protein
VDFGDGVMHELFAEDVGGAVNGAHIDIAVETHQEALDCGIDYATVYWK